MEFVISLDHLGEGPVGNPVFCVGALEIVPNVVSSCTSPWTTCQQWLVVCLVSPVQSQFPHVSSGLYPGFIRQGHMVARRVECQTSAQSFNSCFATEFWCYFGQTMQNMALQPF